MGLMIQVYEIYIYGVYIYTNMYIYIYITYVAYITYIYYIYKLKLINFVSVLKCSVILNLFLLTYEHIYNVTYNRYVQLTIGSVIRVYYRVV